eukprot:m.98604 g.98604  ORF g.98604 m.98604 type:complete len:74 (-) comp15559_c0_seq2:207-428(-)
MGLFLAMMSSLTEAVRLVLTQFLLQDLKVREWRGWVWVWVCASVWRGVAWLCHVLCYSLLVQSSELLRKNHFM